MLKGEMLGWVCNCVMVELCAAANVHRKGGGMLGGGGEGVV
jgi:hypothetical protein